MGDLVRAPFSEVGSTLEVLDRLGVTPEHFRRIRTDENYAQNVVANILQIQVLGNIYTITIDYSKTIEQMVAAGGYDYANPDITTEHFRPRVAASSKSRSS